MKIAVLVDNKTENPVCEAEWGLSLLIEICGQKILYDAGASDMFIQNAKALQIDLSKIDAVVVSHGHYDHTGGIPTFLSLNTRCKCYIRENAFRNYYEKENDDEYLHVGIKWTPEQIKEIANRFVLTSCREFIDDSVEVISCIPDRGISYTENSFYWLTDDMEYISDDMSHEQILLIHENQKIAIFSGCSHSGVISILDYVKKIYPEKTIEAFVAGMHLYSLDETEINGLLDKMEGYGVNYFVPLHCTGMKAILKMKERFAERCIIATSGDTISL